MRAFVTLLVAMAALAAAVPSELLSNLVQRDCECHYEFGSSNPCTLSGSCTPGCSVSI